MKDNSIQDDGNYYSGGLAEIVSQPSELTYSFLRKWFTGRESIGKAMNILGLPFENVDLSILVIVNNELVVNLSNEEQTLYQKTIFSYKKQKKNSDLPQLNISLKKVTNPKYLFNSFKILLAQSKWIASPGKALNFANKLLETMPVTLSAGKDPETVIKNELLPQLIAIGVMAEFFQHLLYREYPKEIQSFQEDIAKKISSEDWFFCSLSDQMKVKNGEMPFEKYIKLYGIRADKDYELTLPRWYETPEIIKKRIENFHTNNPKENFDQNINIGKRPLINEVASFQILRSEAKRKVLIFIDLLRKSIDPIKLAPAKKNLESDVIHPRKKSEKGYLMGQGMPVSKGLVTGAALIVNNNSISIPENTIGIFPNASPEFATQYPKCKGMIFLRGGQTSHGAIVAREFGIPALIDSEASKMQNYEKIELDGAKGAWKIIS